MVPSEICIQDFSHFIAVKYGITYLLLWDEGGLLSRGIVPCRRLERVPDCHLRYQNRTVFMLLEQQSFILIYIMLRIAFIQIRNGSGKE